MSLQRLVDNWWLSVHSTNTTTTTTTLSWISSSSQEELQLFINDDEDQYSSLFLYYLLFIVPVSPSETFYLIVLLSLSTYKKIRSKRSNTKRQTLSYIMFCVFSRQLNECLSLMIPDITVTTLNKNDSSSKDFVVVFLQTISVFEEMSCSNCKYKFSSVLLL